MDIRPPTPRRARILKECIQSGKDPVPPSARVPCPKCQDSMPPSAMIPGPRPHAPMPLARASAIKINWFSLNKFVLYKM